MKKTIIILLTILLIPLPSLAIHIPGYEGGIQNENTYKEVIFVTGEPIIMEGTLNIKTKEKDNTIKETYTYKLENLKEDAQLKRTIKITTTLEPKDNQITSTRTLDSFKETINIGDRRYEAKDEAYQWNQGTVTHKTPLLSYYAGDISARKTYTIDRGSESVTVNTLGKSVGYNSPWSATETQTMDYTIEYEDKLDPDNRWEGTATVEASYNKTKYYDYEENIPQQISFKVGCVLTEKHDNVLKYNYDLPRMREDTIVIGRNIGKDSFSIDTNPIITRLNIPAAKDILGHENEDELLLLASMEGLPLQSRYIGPDTPMSRGEFAKALIQSMDIPIEKQEETRTRRIRRNQPEAPPLFKDVNKNHPNFEYIQEVGNRGIMVGAEQFNFTPDRPLSRAEAYTTIIRLLGFENLTPMNKNYTTGYKDDKTIPASAKDYIYIAKELGMADRGEYFYPNRQITKGESAKLIIDFINYLQKDLKNDYRENVLNN